MRNLLRYALIMLLPSLLADTTLAAPPDAYVVPAAPQALQDDRPKECTITYLMEDIATNDTYAARMRISPAQDATANSTNRLPCPNALPERINQRALDFCRERAASVKDCVFADMGRGFSDDPERGQTSAGGSRCASDLSSQIGIACWSNGKFDVCNVACGQTASEAQRAAHNRCEAKHGKECNITGSVPVLAP